MRVVGLFHCYLNRPCLFACLFAYGMYHGDPNLAVLTTMYSDTFTVHKIILCRI